MNRNTRALLFIISLGSLQTHADQIRNRYTHRVLVGSDEAEVRIGIPGKRLGLAEWTHVLAKGQDTGPICLREDLRRCLNFDGKQVMLSPRSSQASQQWQRQPVPDTIYYRLRNLSRPDAYLHIENGPLAVGKIMPNWWSAMWVFDREASHDARSVHLQYDSVSNAYEMYIESKVVESHPATYFAALGFGGGYFGIQELPGATCTTPGKTFSKQIIFSLWNEDGSPEKNPAPSALAQVIKLGDGVKQRPFSGEGSGAQTTKCFNWIVNATYKFYLRARVEGRYTIYTAYFRAPNDNAWTFIAQAKRPASGALINNVYSFVEDFRRSGTQEGVSKKLRSPFYRRAADFMNPWFKRPNGSWLPVDSARFTAWGEDHPQTNISAKTVDANGITFRLETGGPVIQTTKLDTTIQATTQPTKPPSAPK